LSVETKAEERTTRSGETALAAQALIEAMRPRQWAKNVFVLAGIVFAGQLFDPRAQLRVLACFALFCAASSSVYLVNDVLDRKSDAHHPVKRARAIASGRLSPAAAIAAATVLAAAALAFAARLNLGTLAILAAYLGSTFAYSLLLKRVLLLDVMIVAGGFVLRAAAGAACIDAQISPWLLVCSFLLALFLALGKRRSELVLLGEGVHEQRRKCGEAVGEVDRLPRRVRAGTRYHRHPAVGLLDAPFDHALVLLVRQRGALAGGADRHQAIGALGDLPVDQAAEGLLVERAVAERGDKRGERAPEARLGGHDTIL